jgi:hypothetical protein
VSGDGTLIIFIPDVDVVVRAVLDTPGILEVKRGDGDGYRCLSALLIGDVAHAAWIQGRSRLAELAFHGWHRRSVPRLRQSPHTV